MKRWISTCALVLTTALAAGILTAQETKKDPPGQLKGYEPPARQGVEAAKAARNARTKRVDTRDAPRPTRPGARRNMPQRPGAARGMMHQQQIRALQSQLARKKQAFAEYSGELKAIRKVALGEDAKKTVEYIDKLIARKQKEFDTAVKDTEDKTKAIRARVEKQAKEQAEKYKKMRGPRPTPPKPKGPDAIKIGDRKNK